MTRPSKQSKTLSIRIPLTTIVGCYDIQEVIGQSTVNLPVVTIVVKSITALIQTMRNEGKLPVYPDDESMSERLGELLGANIPRAELDAISLPQLDTESTLPSIQNEFTSLVEKVAESISSDPAIIEGEYNPESVAQPAVAVTFSSILAENPEDSVVLGAKGDALAEEAIVSLYPNLAADQRGSDLAKRLLESTKNLLQSLKDQQPTMEK